MKPCINHTRYDAECKACRDRNGIKPSVEERLGEVFGIVPIKDDSDVKPEIAPVEDRNIVRTDYLEVPPSTPMMHPPVSSPDEMIKDDLATARNFLYDLLEKGRELVDNANFFAKEKQDAKTLEAAAVAQKEARESALALLNLHKTKAEIDRLTGMGQNDKGSSGGDTNIENATVFIGTTTELTRKIRQMKAIDADYEDSEK